VLREEVDEAAEGNKWPRGAWYVVLIVMDAAILKKVALFQGLTQVQLQKIAQLATQKQFEGSTPLFLEGDPGAAMYVVGKGKVRISKRVPGVGEEALAILEEGQYFGEMALIEESPRSADAIAHVPCTVYEISRESLEQLMFTDKELAYVLLWTFVRTLSERLRETNDKIRGFFALSSFGPK
jgi:CRP/FNR family transcriptional regulator, cyclic AMP receptor protein